MQVALNIVLYIRSHSRSLQTVLSVYSSFNQSLTSVPSGPLFVWPKYSKFLMVQLLFTD